MKLGQLASKLLLEKNPSPLKKKTQKIIFKGGENFLIITHVINHTLLKKKEKKEFKETIRVLMLDTSQVHSLLGLLKNFENKTDIHADVTILPHHRLYETIVEKYRSNNEQPYDVFMYDIPWLPSLASEQILEDITT